MIELLVFGALATGALTVAAIVGVVFLLLKLVFWAVLLPLRLLWKLITIPIWFTVGALGLALGAVAVPVVLMALLAVGVVGIIAAFLAVALPLTPFVLLALMLWAIFRRTPAAV